jgi:hypothetical protein
LRFSHATLYSTTSLFMLYSLTDRFGPFRTIGNHKKIYRKGSKTYQQYPDKLITSLNQKLYLGSGWLFARASQLWIFWLQFNCLNKRTLQTLTKLPFNRRYLLYWILPSCILCHLFVTIIKYQWILRDLLFHYWQFFLCIFL